MSNFKIDNYRLNQAFTKEDSHCAKSPDQNDVHDFEEQLKRKEDEKQGNQKNQSENSFSFENFFSKAFDTDSAPKTQAAQLNQSTQQSEIQTKLVEQILVSQPDSPNQEIRLRLSCNVLADTEISIMKSPDGSLNIKLISSNPASFQTLVANQYSLKEQLTALDSNLVNITLENPSAEDNDSNRRSAAYQEYTNEDD